MFELKRQCRKKKKDKNEQSSLSQTLYLLQSLQTSSQAKKENSRFVSY